MNIKNTINLSDGTILTPIKSSFSEDQIKQFLQTFDTPEYQNYVADQMAKQMYRNSSNPTKNNKCIQSPKEVFEFLTNRIDSIQVELKEQTDEYQKIHYENIKLNAQISVLNQTIDSNREKIDDLLNANTNLKVINETLKENNKHYWRNTFLISFVVAAIFFILGILC